MVEAFTFNDFRRWYLKLTEGFSHYAFTDNLTEGGQVIADPGQENPVQFNSGFSNVVVEYILADYCAGIAVDKLMFNFAAGIDRADRGYCATYF